MKIAIRQAFSPPSGSQVDGTVRSRGLFGPSMLNLDRGTPSKGIRRASMGLLDAFL